MSVCARCQRPLNNDWRVFMDRKFHYPVCFLVFEARYHELRFRLKFDHLSVKRVNDLLDMLQWYDPTIHN